MKTLVVGLARGATARHVNARLEGKTVRTAIAQNQASAELIFHEKLALVPGRKLQIELACR